MTRLRICGTDVNFTGIQGFVSDGQQTVALTPFGFQFQCADWDVDADSFIAKIKVTFTEAKGVKHLQAVDQKGVGIERGRDSIEPTDLQYEVEFDQYEALSGFVGYEDKSIEAIGFYRYKCATRPSDNTGTVADNDTDADGEGEGENELPEGESATGDNEGEGDGEGEEDGIIPSPDDNGADNTDDTDDVDDKPLDEDEARENETNETLDTLTEQNNMILVEQEEESNLSTILIILVCILVPLVCILASIVYLFRKNKKNAVIAANIRRLSSIKK